MLCVIASHSQLYVFSLIVLKLIKLPQSVVEVELVLCFSILHNQVIYSGNFYMIYFYKQTCESLIDFEQDQIDRIITSYPALSTIPQCCS